MQWGTGEHSALARREALTRQYLDAIGVTLEMARAWTEFYENAVSDNPHNGSAKGRAVLMHYAADLLEEHREER